MPHTDQPQGAGGVSGRRALLSLLTLLILTGLMVYIFKDNIPDMRAAIARVSWPQVLLLLGLGLTYPLLDAEVCRRIIFQRLPGYSYRRALDVTLLGTFGNVATFGAGTLAMQSYDLYLSGLAVGPGVGLMTLEYVIHKTAVLAYAGLLLVCNRQWLTSAGTSGLMRYLLPACLVVALIIAALVLLCTSRSVQRLAYRALGLLPQSGKWQKRRASWTAQLDRLGEESRRLLADRPLCAKLFLLEVAKLALLFCIPWLGVRFMGLGELGFWEGQTLAALMMLLSNALPNLAGMGSIETAFYLVFSGFIGESGAMSALVLYRLASYYFPFVVSCAAFFAVQRRWTAGRARS